MKTLKKHLRNCGVKTSTVVDLPLYNMRLALFSQLLIEEHKKVLAQLLSKPFDQVKFLYINTPGNYKPYKSKWMTESETRWRRMFPQFQEFDIERAYRVDPAFDFKTFLSEFDFVFVSGGNTFILSYWMQKTGVREILKNLIIEDKVVYGGESAGAVDVAKTVEFASDVDDPNKAPKQIDEGLGIVDFAIVPHWNTPEHQELLEDMKRQYEESGVKTYTLTDEQGIFVNGEEIIYI